MTDKYAIAIASGGLDSTTMVYDLLDKGYRVETLSFNYGQRHRKELTFAGMHARTLSLRHDIVDLSRLGALISNSALTSQGTGPELGHSISDQDKPWQNRIEVPDGHYAEDTMKQTVVPNRNMIMLAIACGVAVNRKATTIAIGVHAGDHFIYPDCRPLFMSHLGNAMLAGNEGFDNFWQEISAQDPEHRQAIQEAGWISTSEGKSFQTAQPITTPYLNSTKADIAYRSMELGVPLHLTWSCYKGGENHCGRCGTCVERLEAIAEASARFHGTDREHPYNDRTVYDDTEYWKTTIKETHNA